MNALCTNLYKIWYKTLEWLCTLITRDILTCHNSTLIVTLKKYQTMNNRKSYHI